MTSKLRDVSTLELLNQELDVRANPEAAAVLIQELKRRLRLTMAALAPLKRAPEYYYGPDPK